jgi:hypothetical protein
VLVVQTPAAEVLMVIESWGVPLARTLVAMVPPTMAMPATRKATPRVLMGRELSLISPHLVC